MTQYRWVGFLLMLGLLGCNRKPDEVVIPSIVDDTGMNPTSDKRINPTDGAEMVFIPSGEFLMGTDSEEIDQIWNRLQWKEEWKQHTKNEQPAHRVRVDGFWMYRNTVTVAQYRRFCETTKRSMPDPPSWGWSDTHPMVNVRWEDAKAYCTWAGGRLPYEAEWEYAARGGNTGLEGKPRTVFVWGDQYPKNPVANLTDISFKKSHYYNPNFFLFTGYEDGYTHTSPVGTFPPNDFGLHDMAGNVWQWCEDWSESEYYRTSPKENPHGPSTGKKKVLRGGAFDTPPEMTRTARRVGSLPNVRHDEKGFRCVLEP